MPKKYYMFSATWEDLALGVCEDAGQYMLIHKYNKVLKVRLKCVRTACIFGCSPDKCCTLTKIWQRTQPSSVLLPTILGFPLAYSSVVLNLACPLEISEELLQMCWRLGPTTDIYVLLLWWYVQIQYILRSSHGQPGLRSTVIDIITILVGRINEWSTPGSLCQRWQGTSRTSPPDLYFF